MPANASTITRHLPIITPRIEFTPAKHFGAPPVITPRIDFGTTIRFPPGDTETGPGIETESGSLNNSDSDSEVDADIVDDVLTGTLIPKPTGQPGRPHSGGYRLDVVLKLVHEKADEILDTKKSYRCQKHNDLDMICEFVESKHPILKKYKGCWPVKPPQSFSSTWKETSLEFIE